MFIKKGFSLLLVLTVFTTTAFAPPQPEPEQQQQQQQGQQQGQIQGQQQQSTNVNINNQRTSSRSSAHAGAVGVGNVDTDIKTEVDIPIQPLQPVVPYFVRPPLQKPFYWTASLSPNAKLKSKTQYTIYEASKVFKRWSIDTNWKGALRKFKYDLVSWDEAKPTKSCQMIPLAEFDQEGRTPIATLNITAKDADKFLGIFGPDTVKCSESRLKWAAAVVCMTQCGGTVVVYESNVHPLNRARAETMASLPAIGGQQGSWSMNIGGMVGSTESEGRPALRAWVLR